MADGTEELRYSNSSPACVKFEREKEAELAEVRSELAYAQQDTQAAKEELVGTQQELAHARVEKEEFQTNCVLNWSRNRKTIEPSV